MGVKEKIEITTDCKSLTRTSWVFRMPLREQGDFLVHFAGVHDAKKMNSLIDEILAGKTPRLSMF
jgi:hypothetical protein